MNHYKLSNKSLKIEVAAHGAELVSLYDKTRECELLWQNKPDFWNRHNPILFPNVGKQAGMGFTFDGIFYPSGQHGFARDLDFKPVEEKDDYLRFVLTSSAKTKEIYPFDFELGVSYRLKENELEITWDVKNTGNGRMYFTIGAHPAFATPPKKDGYSLYFQDKELLHFKLLDTKTGTVLPEIYNLKLDDHRLYLSENMFVKDALIFDDGQIERCILVDPDGRDRIELISPDFPNYGIWSKPGAPFVCLEPWAGRADDYGFDGELPQKPGITALKAGESFNKKYSIKVI